MRKGVVFILDALLAFSIALILLVALSGTQYARFDSASKMSFRNLHYLSGDILDVLNKRGVLDGVGENWVDAGGNESSEAWVNATETMRYYLERLVPQHVGYRLTIDGETLVENITRKPHEKSIAQTHASRMLVGYGRDLPSHGTAARAFITGIAGKNNSAYAYFGGFTGEGRITQKIILPETLEGVERAYVELNAGHPFDLIVNGVDSGCCSPTGPTGMRANVAEYIASPETLFNAGENTVELDFAGASLPNQYIGGGFIRVDYNTTDFETPADSGVTTRNLPGVEGIINVYEGVDVPGTLYSMNAFLHYKSNYTVYLSFGDTVVYQSAGSGLEENITLDDAQLSPLLDYNTMSGGTTPVRIGTTDIITVAEESNADVVLTTDLSFSMWDDRCMEGDWHLIYDRDDPALDDPAPAEEVCTSECIRDDGLLCHYPDYWNGYTECGNCRYGCWRSSGCNVNNGGACTLPCYTCVSYGGEGAPQAGHPYGGSYCYDCTNLGCQYCFNQDEDELWCGIACGPNVYTYYGVNGTPSDPLEPSPAGRCSLYLCSSEDRGTCSFNTYITCDQEYVDDHTTYEADGLPSISHLTCPNQCFACNMTGVGLARQLDGEFIDIILNYSGNRVGLASYGDSTYGTHNLSNDMTSLSSEVDSYYAGGETCICCAIDDTINIMSESNSSRNKYAIVMTDGVANVRCGNAGTDLNGDGQITAKDDAIQSACTARQDHNITVYAVGFGGDAGADTLQRIADCGNGSYYASNDTAGLSAIYADIATYITNASYSSQVINVTGEFVESILYPDSFIRLYYTPSGESEYGEISVTSEANVSENETSCSGKLWIPEDVRVVDFTVTSYSGDHWTDYVAAGTGGPTTAYTLRDGGYGSNYTVLGDPFKVVIPPTYITAGANNTVLAETGDSPTEPTGCSLDNKIVYTLGFGTMVDYGDVFQNSEGCNWSIMFSDDSIIETGVPWDVDHNKNCSYNSTNITYSLNDAIDDAVYRLMNKLDLDDDGRVDVLLNPQDITFEGTYTGSVRSLWGPLNVKLILWM